MKRGFGSLNYPKDKAREVQRKGGSRKVPKGFGKMDKEKRMEIFRRAGRAGKGVKHGAQDPMSFDVK